MGGDGLEFAQAKSGYREAIAGEWQVISSYRELFPFLTIQRFNPLLPSGPIRSFTPFTPRFTANYSQ
jgi:hypothetical protein